MSSFDPKRYARGLLTVSFNLLLCTPAKHLQRTRSRRVEAGASQFVVI